MLNPELLPGREIDFLGRQFYIDPSVHRPRESTAFITRTGYIPYLNQVPKPGVTAADIGVGSGVTAISCALDSPNLSTMYGVDLYGDALRVARRNITQLQVQEKVTLLQGDLYAPLLDRQVDVIIANLPFATTSKVTEIQADATAPSEPLSGIHGGKTGFELYEKMFEQLRGYKFLDQLQGMWLFCATDHLDFVRQYHNTQFKSFRLRIFEDKYKPHFSHYLFTKMDFKLGAELREVKFLDKEPCTIRVGR